MTMRVARLHGPGDLRVGDEPAPNPADGFTLVRITAVGICGSDLHWYGEGGIGDAQLAAPLVPGHEIAGVAIDGPYQGRPVAVDPALPCGHCRLCHAGHPNLCPNVVFAGHGRCDGGLTQILRWPTAALHPVPDGMSPGQVAMLEPFGIAIHSMDLAHLRPAMSVGVFGCGPIGLLLIQLARAMGAGRVVATEPLPHRRVAAAAAGADLVLTPDDVADADPDLDVVFEVAGTAGAVRDAIAAAAPGGRVVLVGIPDNDVIEFPASTARRKGLTIAMSRRMKDTVYPRGIELFRRGAVDLDSIITDRYPLAEAPAAFTHAAARTGLKTVVDPSLDLPKGV
jgi:L-iditol 2-dehydrogenase